MYRTDFWTLWEKARMGCFKRTASTHVYYLGWNRSPAQVGCMRQVLGPVALGRPRGIGWRGRWEGGSGWGIHVNPWLINVYVWQKPLQYCKVISLQLIKKNSFYTIQNNNNKRLPRLLVVKNPPANARDIREPGLIPEWGRSPRGDNGNSLQCSCLENPMDRGAWWAVIHESWIRLKQLSTTQQQACMISVSQHPL